MAVTCLRHSWSNRGAILGQWKNLSRNRKRYYKSLCMQNRWRRFLLVTRSIPAIIPSKRRTCYFPILSQHFTCPLEQLVVLLSISTFYPSVRTTCYHVMFLFYPRNYSVHKKNLLCSCSISTFYLSVRTTCYVPVLSLHFTRPLEQLIMFMFYPYILPVR